MIKSFIILIVLLLFVFGCNSIFSTVQKDVKDTIKERIKEIPVKELIIVSKTNYLLSPLVVALFTGIILLALGVRTIGVGVIIASVICIVLLLMITLYTKIIALIGILVLVIGIVFLFKKLYDNNIFGKEMIKTIEKAKNYISEENKEKLKVELDEEQSKETKKIVSKIKGEKNV